MSRKSTWIANPNQEQKISTKVMAAHSRAGPSRRTVVVFCAQNRGKRIRNAGLRRPAENMSTAR